MFAAEHSAPLIPSSQRLVLYLQGYPSGGAARATCESLLHVCGGDSQRTFDLKRRTIDDTLRHAVRVRAFQNQQRPAICVVHETHDLALLMELRHDFEDLIPIAKSAVWTIFWDHKSDADFLGRIQSQGTLIGDVCDGATWRHTTGTEFLLLSSFVDNPQALAVEAECVARSRSPRRGWDVEARPTGFGIAFT